MMNSGNVKQPVFTYEYQQPSSAAGEMGNQSDSFRPEDKQSTYVNSGQQGQHDSTVGNQPLCHRNTIVLESRTDLLSALLKKQVEEEAVALYKSIVPFFTGNSLKCSPLEFFIKVVMNNWLDFKELMALGKKWMGMIDNSSIDDVMWNMDLWEKNPALMALVACGHSKNVIGLIQELGAYPFLQDKNNKNLLHLVIAKGAKQHREKLSRENQFPLFRELLNTPITRDVINTQDKYGLTPLHYACARQDHHYIMPLIDAGADPAIKDCNDNDCITILQLDRQKRTNIIALAVNIQTLKSKELKLQSDYKKSDQKNYFFENKPYGKTDPYNVFEFAEPLSLYKDHFIKKIKQEIEQKHTS